MPGTAKQPPVLLDMATSRIALGKVRVALNKGENLPEIGSLTTVGNQAVTRRSWRATFTMIQARKTLRVP